MELLWDILGAFVGFRRSFASDGRVAPWKLDQVTGRVWRLQLAISHRTFAAERNGGAPRGAFREW